jgi:hypothetical protein
MGPPPPDRTTGRRTTKGGKPLPLPPPPPPSNAGPHPQLVEILLPAYLPCPAFQNACSYMQWQPEDGRVPRGFYGATGRLDEVRLVLVCAQPGMPGRDEAYSGSPEELLRAAWDRSYADLNNRADAFSRNLRDLLNICFPRTSLDEQMRVTWFANAMLCSSERTGADVWRECRDRYLNKQLRLFPQALVVALGETAAARLRDMPGVLKFNSPGPPGGHSRAARETWKRIPERLRDKRGGQEVQRSRIPS